MFFIIFFCDCSSFPESDAKIDVIMSKHSFFFSSLFIKSGFTSCQTFDCCMTLCETTSASLLILGSSTCSFSHSSFSRIYTVSRFISVQWIGRRYTPSFSNISAIIRVFPSTCPCFTTVFNASWFNVIELTKSVKLIASLHFSFKKKFTLNCVLFVVFVLLTV